MQQQYNPHHQPHGRPQLPFPASSLDALRNVVSSVINEEKEKQKRRLNLIVHNMAESYSDQLHAQKEQVIAHLQDILTSQLEVRAHISRLGKIGGPKPRLLKISVESDEEKAAIL